MLKEEEIKKIRELLLDTGKIWRDFFREEPTQDPVTPGRQRRTGRIYDKNEGTGLTGEGKTPNDLGDETHVLKT